MRRGVRNVLGAGAAVVCLGGLLAACGGESGDGYVATGAAGASPERAPGKAVGPTGDVKLVPLDGSEASGGDGKDGRGDGSTKAASGSGEGSGGDSEGKSPGAEGSSGGGAAPEGGAVSDDGANPGRTEGSSPGGAERPGQGGSSGSPSAPGKDEPSGGASPGGPAKLGVGDPKREPADKRWCEKVTLTFHNTGGSPVRSGQVTFGTHIIGALGVDWDTIESTVDLPAPIGAGQRVKKTWPVCVDAWRVPLGMHVETQDVDVDWK
ncbi:hypothetical protein [Streptomyces sp. NPDC052114]|uniref:hypothetical protein n=1 Tax=unclassified Streptomyces TaxID=2593676 RepID=UPI00342697D3